MYIKNLAQSTAQAPAALQSGEDAQTTDAAAAGVVANAELPTQTEAATIPPIDVDNGASINGMPTVSKHDLGADDQTDLETDHEESNGGSEAGQAAGQKQSMPHHGGSGGAGGLQQMEEEYENDHVIRTIKKFHTRSMQIISESLLSKKPAEAVARQYVAHLSTFQQKLRQGRLLRMLNK